MTTQDAPSGAASGPRLARYGTAFLFVAIPVALFLVILFLLCDNVWFSPDSVLGYQALIPLGALALAWNRRFEVQKTVTELAMLFPDPDHPKRRGNEILAILGACIILLGVLASTPVIGLFGFLVMVAGIVFCIYGPFVLKELAGPIGYLTLTFIPLPVLGLMGPLSAEFHYRSVAFTGYILKALRREPHIQGTTLTLNGQAPLYVPASFSGLEMLLGAVAFAVLVILWHRLQIGAILLMLFTALVLALAVNMLRVLILVNTQAPEWLPAPVFLIIICVILWLAGSFLARSTASRVRDL